MEKRIYLSTLFICCLFPLFAQVNDDNPESWNLINALQPVAPENVFVDDPEHLVWCGSVIKARGRYYMFYSRWDRSEDHLGWATCSEVALAVSDKPGGPYKHVKVVLPARGVDYWDGTTTHNPYIVEHKGKYYLYYMGTTAFINPQKPLNYNPEWYTFRNGQRIGVAVATDVLGEWERFEAPVLTTSSDVLAHDAMLVSNPAVTIDPNGRTILVYKQVCKNGTYQGGSVRFGVAFAPSPTGVFVKHSTPIFEKRSGDGSAWMVAEDPFLWQKNGNYYAIIRDVQGEFSGNKGGLAMMTSSNAIDWSPAPHPQVMNTELRFSDQTVIPHAVERPWLLFENGKPIYLFGAIGLAPSRKESGNVAIPLR